MLISFFFEGIEAFIHTHAYIKLVERIISSEKRVIEQVNIILICKDKLLEINKLHLNHDFHTDVILFDLAEIIEIYVGMETVLNNSLKYNVLFCEELGRMIVHGVLHSCGYSDNTELKRKKMKLKEDEYLGLLK
ncbi:rRNA maturation RNase YbeY [Bacteroidota bacterium]